MKNILLAALAATLFTACGTETVQDRSNTGPAPDRPQRSETVTGHTTENRSLPVANSGRSGDGGTKTKWSQGGEPIDTAEFDAAIAAAVKANTSNPTPESKKALAEAYFKRGVALTDARQYASALGDYRRAVKLDPEHKGSKDWIEQIIGIYEMMKKDYPREGEEPPPLPWKA